MEFPREICRRAVERYRAAHPDTEGISAGVESPPQPDMGDLAITFPLRAGDALETSPRHVAEGLAEEIETEESRVSEVRVDGPGFVNCVFDDAYLLSVARECLDRESLPLRRFGDGERVLLEFVSANPTGPLHVGHGRGAVYGDVVRRLLESHGFDVTAEYYVNDAGHQMTRLGESLQLRLRQHHGEDVELGEEHYRGEYLAELGRKLDLDPDREVRVLADRAADEILGRIFDDLSALDVTFDSVVREREVADESSLDDLLDRLDRGGHLYEEAGAIYLRTTDGDDDKDRVLIRSDGRPTYFANDLVYHHRKYQRSFERLINVWGHDHHGYRDRLLAGLDFLGHEPSRLKVELYQLVNLFRDGEPLSMSTRQGDFVPLRDLIQEVGTDAVRFNFLTRSHHRPLDFDVRVAAAESEENPVYYVQYAHTRLASMLEKAPSELPPYEDDLVEEGHRLLVRALDFSYRLKQATLSREPHRVTGFLRDLAGQFHTYYAHHRVLDEDHPERTHRRLTVVRLLRSVFRGGLKLLGVEAPDVM